MGKRSNFIARRRSVLKDLRGAWERNPLLTWKEVKRRVSKRLKEQMKYE